jgi:hypothetical protein
MNKDLSPWFRRALQPEHVGVYQVEPAWSWAQEKTFYSYWNGRFFNWITDDVDDAFRLRVERGAGSSVQLWRGLAKKP